MQLTMAPSDDCRRCQRILKLMAAAIFAATFIFCVTQVLVLPIFPASSISSIETSDTQSPEVQPSPDLQTQSDTPSIEGLTHMQALPKHLVPTAANKRRLILIGDIHGMHLALDKLLEKVKFDPERDHVIAAGDMVNKGPNSPAVVSRLMDINASAVRGNHEDRVLLALAGIEARQSATTLEEASEEVDIQGAKGDLKTARKLSKKQVKWLTQLPLILTIDQLDMMIVHAGLVPGIKPEKQDPWAVMNMRTLVYPNRQELRRSVDADKETQEDSEEDEDEEYNIERDQLPVPVDTHAGEKWARAWDQRQRSQRKHARRTVVYGHDARRGLTLGKYTFGLDSGCVGKGQLTAMIVEADGKEEGAWKSKIKQIGCRKLKK